MKIFLTIIILLNILVSFNLTSQNTTFEYLFSSNSDEYVFDIYETQYNDIIFCGSAAPVTNRYNKSLLLVKFDSIGNLIDSIVYSISDKSISAKLLLVSDTSNFVVVTMIQDTLETRNQTALGLYNLNLDLTLSNETIYNFDSIYLFEDVGAAILSNSNILVSVSLRIHPQVPRSYSYEFNDTFDSLRSKYYPVGSRSITHIHEMPDNCLWTINMILDQYEILDTALNIISEQKIPDWLHGNPTAIWDTDSSFYLVSKNDYPFPSNNLGFIKQFHPMDTTGHIYNHWRISDTVDYSAFWGGIDFKNKDSIFIGATRNMWGSYYNTWPSWFIILQTDSLLNIRWERFYGGDAYYMMGKIIASNDGGCIVAGTRYDYLNTTDQETDIIILKLNSEGLITSTHEDPVMEMHEAIVYPNPGSEIINVRIAVQYKHSVFELFDMNGAIVIKQNFTGTQGTVNTAFLEHGTYIYRLSSNDGLFETGKWLK